MKQWSTHRHFGLDVVPGLTAYKETIPLCCVEDVEPVCQGIITTVQLQTEQYLASINNSVEGFCEHMLALEDMPMWGAEMMIPLVYIHREQFQELLDYIESPEARHGMNSRYIADQLIGPRFREYCLQQLSS